MGLICTAFPFSPQQSLLCVVGIPFSDIKAARLAGHSNDITYTLRQEGGGSWNDGPTRLGENGVSFGLHQLGQLVEYLHQ